MNAQRQGTHCSKQVDYRSFAIEIEVNYDQPGTSIIGNADRPYYVVDHRRSRIPALLPEVKLDPLFTKSIRCPRFD